MFKSVEARYVLRGCVSAVLAALAVAGTVWIDNPYIKVASAGLGVLAGYLGIGAVVPAVEPSIGKKLGP